VKIADFVPKTAEELNKIFTDVSLDEEECNKILEIVKDY
jgi:DNA-directed RNA polymerase subunit F